MSSFQNMGIRYFGVDTDIKDDDKLFALKTHYAGRSGAYDMAAGYAALGRLIEVLAEIYRDGFAMEVTPTRRLRLSQQLGMAPDDFDEFIGVCVEVGLFDQRIWEQCSVLTSRGIQKRYYVVAHRRYGELADEHKRFLLIGEDDLPKPPPSWKKGEASAPDGSAGGQTDNTMRHSGGNMNHDAPTMTQGERTMNQDDPETSPTARLIEDKEKENLRELQPNSIQGEEENPTRATRTGASEGSGARAHEQPYPLSCFGMVCDSMRFCDENGAERDTPWDAFLARLHARAPDADAGLVAKAVSKKCRPDCTESPYQVSACFNALCTGLDRYDQKRCANPIPLLVKVFSEDGSGVSDGSA